MGFDGFRQWLWRFLSTAFNGGGGGFGVVERGTIFLLSIGLGGSDDGFW
jgi:hypothetical protein